MSLRHLIVVCLVVAPCTGCLESVKNVQDKIEWKTMDSVFQYIIPEAGSAKFSKGDSVKVQINAVLTNRVTPVDTNYLVKNCLRFAELVTLQTLRTNEKGIIKKSEEGILKADFSAIDLNTDFVVTAYLNGDVGQNEIDTLIKKIRRLPEVYRAEFISKEEAKKRWLEAGEEDFTDSLKGNPLPASINIRIEPDYLKESLLKEFANGLKTNFSGEVFEVIYPVDLVPVMECFKKYIFLISYKT